MSTHNSPSEITRRRIAKWVENAVPIENNKTWTEFRQAIDFGGHTYIIGSGQVYVCVHCGHYDPEWSATEVLTFFRDLFGIKPYEIEISCSISVVEP